MELYPYWYIGPVHVISSENNMTANCENKKFRTHQLGIRKPSAEWRSVSSTTNENTYIFFVLLATMPYVWPNAQHHDKVRDEEEKWDTNYSFVACDYESGHFPDKCDEHIWVRAIRQAQGFSAILRTTRRRKNTQIVHDLVTKMLLNHDMPNSQRMQ